MEKIKDRIEKRMDADFYEQDQKKKQDYKKITEDGIKNIIIKENEEMEVVRDGIKQLDKQNTERYKE